jgi:hypothetical protein
VSILDFDCRMLLCRIGEVEAETLETFLENEGLIDYCPHGGKHHLKRPAGAGGG